MINSLLVTTLQPNHSLKSNVQVFTLGDHSWRKIQPFPVIPIYKFNGL
jgi:F-box interacting protein